MELVLPNNYVELEQEEMMYIDGGAYFTKNQSIMFCAALFGTPQGAISAAVTAAVISRVINWAKRVGGVFGWIAGTVAKVATVAIGKIIYGFGYGALRNGVNISWSWAPWDAFVNVGF